MWYTLASATVAAVTALLIAFVAYPWQKSKDRALKLHGEKLAAYQRFVRAITEHQSLIATTHYNNGDSAKIIEAYPSVVASSYELIFYAPPSVVKECQRYLEAVLAYETFVLGQLGSEKHKKSSVNHPTGRTAFLPSQKARRDAILAIRKDVAEELPQVSEDAISAFFVLTPIEERGAA